MTDEKNLIVEAELGIVTVLIKIKKESEVIDTLCKIQLHELKEPKEEEIKIDLETKKGKGEEVKPQSQLHFKIHETKPLEKEEKIKMLERRLEMVEQEAKEIREMLKKLTDESNVTDEEKQEKSHDEFGEEMKRFEEEMQGWRKEFQ